MKKNGFTLIRTLRRKNLIIVQQGFTLIEILVVVSIFAFLGILITRAILLSVGGSKKSESIIRVRENLDYSLGVIERQIRNANSVPGCPFVNQQSINYLDQDGNPGSFSCINNPGEPGYIASGSATVHLTSDTVDVTQCSFSCDTGTGSNPSVVSIFLNAVDTNATDVQGANVSISTQVSLRNY